MTGRRARVRVVELRGDVARRRRWGESAPAAAGHLAHGAGTASAGGAVWDRILGRAVAGAAEQVRIRKGEMSCGSLAHLGGARLRGHSQWNSKFKGQEFDKTIVRPLETSQKVTCMNCSFESSWS